MKRKSLVIALCGACAFAASNFTAPVVGVARDSQHELHVVYGLAGNFVVRNTAAKDVDDWSFGNGGIARLARKLLLLGPGGAEIWHTSLPTPDVLFAPPGLGVHAMYFIPATGELAEVQQGSTRKFSLEPGVSIGRAIALGASNAGRAELAVCRSGDLWVIAIDINHARATHETLAGARMSQAACRAPAPAMVLLVDSELVAAGKSELIVQPVGGAERRVPLPVAPGATFTLHQAGPGWVQADVSGGQPLMIHFTDGHEGIFGLPAAEVVQ